MDEVSDWVVGAMVLVVLLAAFGGCVAAEIISNARERDCQAEGYVADIGWNGIWWCVDMRDETPCLVPLEDVRGNK